MDEKGGRGKGAEVTTWKFSKTPYAWRGKLININNFLLMIINEYSIKGE